jgi:hypothetical protein
MPRILVLAAAFAALASPLRAQDDTQLAQVTIDSARREVNIIAGPFDLPDLSAHTDHSHSHDTPIIQFAWPIEGWFRGFRMSVIDAEGKPLSRRLIHHLIVANYDRRQLVYPAVERLWGAGIETGSVEVPKTVGIPLHQGTKLGMYIAWHNATGQDLSGVRLRITMLWLPSNMNPRPVDVLPVYMDVNLRVGGGNEFDVPPGRSSKSYEFTVPASGRLLGIGGHLHDYGVEVRLEDAENGKVLTRVRSRRDPDGRVRSMERHLFGVWGEGLKLKADHRYRVVAEYDNPTSETLTKGAMGSIVGIFAPTRLANWPSVQPTDSAYQRDLRFLARRGASSMDMHMHMKMAPDSAAPDSASQTSDHAEHEHTHSQEP